MGGFATVVLVGGLVRPGGWVDGRMGLFGYM